MAEAAATAIGIGSVVSVLQSLLQCYKDFLTARDFGDDFAILQLRAALLENSTTTWATAVGLIDGAGNPRNQFLVAHPTDKNARLVEATLVLIRKHLTATNNELAAYTDDDDEPASSALALTTSTVSQNDKTLTMKRAANKLHRIVYRQHDAQHPGTLKRTTWALVNKARIEDGLNKVTILVDRLNTDFAPVNQKQQLERYCQDIKELKLGVGELRDIIANNPGDMLSQSVLLMLENEGATGNNRFLGMSVAKNGSVNIGDYYHENWRGNGMVKEQGNRDTYAKISVTDTAFVNVGNMYGGKTAFEIRHEQLRAAMRENAGRLQ